MKTLKKILPLTALTAVGTVPVIATSCSNVYVDLYTKLFEPKFDPADADELTSIEAIKLYTDRFAKNEGDAADDFYWGSSIYCREVLGKRENEKVLAYLNHIYDVKIEVNPDNGRPIISYKLKAQVQIKSTAPSGSYSIRSYDLYWEINNLEFWVAHYNTITTTDQKVHNMWSLCPFKFDNERGVWWKELEGNEQVKFDFKTVIKGYGVDGGQNYAWEAAEAAIVDHEHRYVPELSEVYTSVMLFDSYYLNQISPRLDVKEDWFRVESSSNKIENKISFIPGTKTAQKGGTITIKPIGDAYISHVDGSDWEIVGDITFDDYGTIKPEGNEVIATINCSKTPKTGDVIYYTAQADHKNDQGTVDWTDYFFITCMVDNG